MFGRRLKELRKEKNLTQQKLGENINVSSRVVGYYESDERSPDKETLVLIADFFDVSLDYLLCRSDVKNSSHLKKIKNYDMVDELLHLEEDSINQIREYLQLLKLKENNDKGKGSSALENVN